MEKVFFKENETILFQGDSITDCSRNKENGSSLGGGYAMFTSAWLMAKYPQYNLKFINRGISGHRTKDLVDRWDKDCIDLKPDWLSILIGINDTWRRYSENDPTSAEQFEKEYRILLDNVLAKLSVKLIMCEPFVLHCTDDLKLWREDLNPKIKIVRKLAKEYNAILIPLDKIFQKACKLQSPNYWAGDGVHPTLAGHALIAQSWMKYSGLK
ncbi:MAG: SGNH/GDSL hydrolase family protein [Elusimicrobia bacterium]|nr:SGNH/GDSL hydrolase family protein [Elusimicrobiota bacterium]